MKSGAQWPRLASPLGALPGSRTARAKGYTEAREFTTNSIPSFAASDLLGDDPRDVEEFRAEERPENLLRLPPVPFDEDTFALTISVLVKDTYHMAQVNRGKLTTKEAGINTQTFFSRMLATCCLLFMTLFLQIFLLSQVKRFVSAKSVHDMRIVYDEFEIHMYGSDISNMDITPNGKHRGRPEYFNPALFDSLPEDLKAGACCIPLSQPAFFFSVLFVWTVTCLGELKATYSRIRLLILDSHTIRTMGECRSDPDRMKENVSAAKANSDPAHEHHDAYMDMLDGDYGHLLTCEDCKGRSEINGQFCDSCNGTGKRDQDNGLFVIRGLTPLMKAFFCCFCFLPRVGITAYLLWLGCRWLLATNDFSDLILNAVALEFILSLKEVVYRCLSPSRVRHDLESTRMNNEKHVVSESDHSQFKEVASTTSVAAFWVYMYMYHLQLVVPDYRWDVHNVCVDWIKERYAV